MSGGPPGLPLGADLEAKLCRKTEILEADLGAKMPPKRLSKINPKTTLRENPTNSQTYHFGVQVGVPSWSHLGCQVGAILDGKLGSF